MDRGETGPITQSPRNLLVWVMASALSAGLVAWWLWPGMWGAEGANGRSDAGADHAAWFVEVSAESNVDFRHIAGLPRRYYLPEIMSGSVCLFDYDRDGFLDLYFVQGGSLDTRAKNVLGNQLFRNRQDGTFENVTIATGVGDTGYGIGCTCGDYDGDGDVDLYVTNLGPNVLYRNNGDGTFTDVSEKAGVGDPAWGASAAFVDYDADGLLDLYVVNYLGWSQEQEVDCRTSLDQKDYCHPNAYDSPAPDTLFHNLGDGRFADVSEQAGISASFGNGLGLAVGDFNADGRLDVYVANDGMANQLWLNAGDGTFTDQALHEGCALNGLGAAEAGMGVAALDVNGDARPDLFLSHLRDETNTLYLNRDGWFEDATAVLGLGSASLPYTGFGLGFADFDQDGLLDMYVANGRVTNVDPVEDPTNPYAEPNLLFAGKPGGRFEEVRPRGGTAQRLVDISRGAAFGDLDNDGDVDVVVVNNGGRVYLLRNVVGDRGRWIRFRAIDERGHEAIGAIICIKTGDDRQCRPMQRAYSYCSASAPSVHFGLGSAGFVDETWVRWPSGRTESFGRLRAGRLHTLRAGSGRQVTGARP